MKCYNLIENCQFKEIRTNSDDLCFKGHSGGLCEQCDLFNTRKNGSFTESSSFKCYECS